MLAQLLSNLRIRLRAIFRRAAMEQELDDELRFHLERETEKRVHAGEPPAEARRKAAAAFGGLERIKDDARDARGLAFLDVITQDTRYAARGLRSSPGFTAAVVLTLALGIGANAAVFGIVDRLMFRPPGFLRDPGSVNRVYVAYRYHDRDILDRSLEFRRYREMAQWSGSSAQTAGVSTYGTAIGVGEAAVQRIVGAASADFFSFFDATPVIGRFYTAQEDTVPSGALVAVLGYDYWQTQYGGRRDVLGATLQIGPGTFTVIGVAPRGFTGIDEGRVPVAWIPLTTRAWLQSPDYYTSYGWGFLGMLVRRKPGVSVEAATADLSLAYSRTWMAERALSGGPAPVEAARPHVLLGPTQLGRGPEAGPEGRVIFWAIGVALIVLLVACANVANLLLARAFRRRREIAVRLAIGVTRTRLFVQLVTESLLLALLGGAAGLLVGRFAGAILTSLVAPPDPRTGATTPTIADTRTIAFCTVITLMVGVLTGLVPALHAGRDDPLSALKAGAREGSYQRSRTRTLLVVVQSALSVVLLVGAGLFVRSLSNVRAMRLGYDVDPVLFVMRNMRGMNLSPDEQTALIRRLMEAALALPMVENVTTAQSVPFYDHESTGLYVTGIDSVAKLGRFQMQLATPTYFATMGTRILAGRGITTEDRKGAPGAIVVSETMARRLWPDKPAIGQCIRVDADTMPCTSVVGIAEDIKEREMTHAPEPNYYLSADQVVRRPNGLFVRVHGRASVAGETVRRQLQKTMPGASYITVSPLADIVDAQRRSFQVGATMFLVLGGLALLLAVIGLYSVIAYNVAQRTQELGVRIALGAQMGDVLRLVMREGLGFALAGIVIGSALALWAGRAAATLLFDESPRDPMVFAVVAAVLLGAALTASVIPALRAARLNPTVALRAD